MAVTTLDILRARNPFRIYGTALSPGGLLAAKLVALVFFIQGLWRLTDPFVPYLGVFDHVGDPKTFQHILQAVWLIAAVTLFVNVFPRVACAVLGGVIFVALLSSDAFRTNNLTYTALLFILLSLSTKQTLTTILRLQLVVLYGFAALNKLLDRGWRSGAFFESWNTVQGYGHLYHDIANIFPGRSFSATLSWGVILIEFLLMLSFAVPRLVPVGALMVVAYHSSLLFVTGSTFTMFWYALVATAIALAPWPAAPPDVVYPRRSWLNALRLLDLARAFVWEPAGAKGLTLRIGEQVWMGRAAQVRILVFHPVLYFIVYALLASPENPDRRWGAVLAFIVVAVAGVQLAAPQLRLRRAAPITSRV
jgi:hypothetical protein